MRYELNKRLRNQKQREEDLAEKKTKRQKILEHLRSKLMDEEFEQLDFMTLRESWNRL